MRGITHLRVSRMFLSRLTSSVVALSALLAAAGCATGGGRPSAASENPHVAAPSLAAQLRPGDTMMVSLLSIPEPTNSNVQIDEQGFIRLQYIGAVKAAGLTTSELSQSIRDTYISKKFYTTLD